MKIKEVIDGILNNQSYFLSLYHGGTYAYNFDSLLIANNKEVIINFYDCKYKLYGENFKIKRLLENEFEIIGEIDKIEKII